MNKTFTFTEAISLFVRCETQPEIDYFWEKFSVAGEKADVVGSKTNSASPGKSCPQFWAQC
jgi:predicted 3-demethylubiquinone-9 3-methyltransferase (glyoxalase superfamily)